MLIFSHFSSKILENILRNNQFNLHIGDINILDINKCLQLNSKNVHELQKIKINEKEKNVMRINYEKDLNIDQNNENIKENIDNTFLFNKRQSQIDIKSIKANFENNTEKLYNSDSEIYTHMLDKKKNRNKLNYKSLLTSNFLHYISNNNDSSKSLPSSYSSEISNSSSTSYSSTTSSSPSFFHSKLSKFNTNIKKCENKIHKLENIFLSYASKDIPNNNLKKNKNKNDKINWKSLSNNDSYCNFDKEIMNEKISENEYNDDKELNDIFNEIQNKEYHSSLQTINNKNQISLLEKYIKRKTNTIKDDNSEEIITEKINSYNNNILNSKHIYHKEYSNELNNVINDLF